MKAEPVVAQSPERPALSEEEMERKSRAIIDEFLHINDYKVQSFNNAIILHTVCECLCVLLSKGSLFYKDMCLLYSL